MTPLLLIGLVLVLVGSVFGLQRVIRLRLRGDRVPRITVFNTIFGFALVAFVGLVLVVPALRR